ncbi:amidohydrolase family protein [Phenylobacterium sp.]|jgi:imidazolonepropionase-like amidohydrolase|uniref:amidohydrolase family protein n=1 Tax=Phenylobacterium sp. TaxID=1871053 RepID=UPI002F40B9AE
MSLKSVILGTAAALALAAAAHAAPQVLAPPALLSRAVQPYVKVAAKSVVLRHVRLIDGTGAPAQTDRTVVLSGGKIVAVGGPELATPAGADVLDLAGHTVMPGIVGLHDHMYYIARPNMDAAGHSEPPLIVPQMTFSSPRLYLAAGVTTMRTTGSVEPYVDLNVKTEIDAGRMLGPHMDVTAPYLEGPNSPFIQMHPLKDADDARRMVNYWADMGATSFKAYMNITRAELGAAIQEAHKRGLKLTGHLCSVTYPEAADLGIDDLEHGFFVNTQLDAGKTPDKCSQSTGNQTLLKMTPESPEADALIKLLVGKHVAVTSTLPVFEQRVPGHAPLNPKAMAVLTPEAREAYLYARNLVNQAPRERYADTVKEYQNDLGLERKFVAAGGLLLAGPDPTGNGGVIPGFGDQREIELLVEAGFRPEEAVKIATLNGATYLGLADRIGTVAPGKDADLVVVKGDPSKTITDVENVEIVFKDGVGYDPAKLLDSVKGRYGQY